MFIQSRVEEEGSGSEQGKSRKEFSGNFVVLKDTDQDYGLLLYLYYDGRSF